MVFTLEQESDRIKTPKSVFLMLISPHVSLHHQRNKEDICKYIKKILIYFLMFCENNILNG